MLYKITKAQYDALTAEMKLLYVADGDGFKLPLTDYQDPAPLIAARDREKQDAADLRAANAVLVTENTELKKTVPGDVITLRNAHAAALKEAKDASDATIASLRSQHEAALIASATKDVAGDLTATPQNAGVMNPHVSARLIVVWEGDKAVVKIKNADGSVGSALTEETKKTLSKEFIDNPVFAAIVVKSKASGGGAAGGQGGASGSAGADTGAKKFGEMNGVARNELYKRDPAEFDRLAAADKAEKRAAATAPHKPLFQQ